MVLAEIGRAAGGQAVLDNADAVDVETADDRPARSAGRKLRAGDAGFGEQKVAQSRAALTADFLVWHHGDGGELVGHDRQHAGLRRWRSRRGGRSGLRLRRAFAIAAGSGARDAHRPWRGDDGPSMLNWTRRR